jgi:uncharacterized protein (DUF1800 family)
MIQRHVAAAALGLAISVAPAAPKKAPKLTEEQKLTHLLNRAAFGPRPGDLERVRRMGMEAYLDRQLHPEAIDDSATERRLEDLESLRMEIGELFKKYPPPQFVQRQLGLRQPEGVPGPPGTPPADPAARAAQREYFQKLMSHYRDNGLKNVTVLLQEISAQKLIRAVSSERQLQEVMVDFWFNHFNVFWPKNAVRNSTNDFEMNVLRPRVFGKFRDLVLATAKSPAMLVYLDNFMSASPDARPPGPFRPGGPFGPPPGAPRPGAQQAGAPRPAPPPQRPRPGINENYARELMELHTLGVDGGYTQKDVQEVARCFTGWTVQPPPGEGGFVFRPWMHDAGEKVVLGEKIAAGGGIEDGQKVIEILARHPSTAKFIATKLARRFVSDTPPEKLVLRVAEVYTRTDGDIRAMVRAILTSPEFLSAEAYRAKMKSPFELAASAIRALGGATNGAPPLQRFVARMGEPLYQCQPPTGYPDSAEQWVNTGALLERLNFALALASNRIDGTAVDVAGVGGGGSGGDSTQVAKRALTALIGSDVSAETRALVVRQLEEKAEPKADAGPPIESRPPFMGGPAGQQGAPFLGDARFGGRTWRSPELQPASVDAQLARAFGLVLGSPEFQRR